MLSYPSLPAFLISRLKRVSATRVLGVSRTRSGRLFLSDCRSSSVSPSSSSARTSAADIPATVQGNGVPHFWQKAGAA